MFVKESSSVELFFPEALLELSHFNVIISYSILR